MSIFAPWLKVYKKIMDGETSEPKSSEIDVVEFLDESNADVDLLADGIRDLRSDLLEKGTFCTRMIREL
jgi:hypothetical protein